VNSVLVSIVLAEPTTKPENSGPTIIPLPILVHSFIVPVAETAQVVAPAFPCLR
jgi:hypothetical protein